METKSVRVDVLVEKHNQLKAKLSRKGLKISDWLRIKIDEELKEK